jgi:hypothetical protein
VWLQWLTPVGELHVGERGGRSGNEVLSPSEFHVPGGREVHVWAVVSVVGSAECTVLAKLQTCCMPSLCGAWLSPTMWFHTRMNLLAVAF